MNVHQCIYSTERTSNPAARFTAGKISAASCVQSIVRGWGLSSPSFPASMNLIAASNAACS